MLGEKTMFLVKDRRFGQDRYVFTKLDPRNDGFRGEVEENVTLDYDMNEICLWPDDQVRPSPRLGRNPRDSKQYKVFKFEKELKDAGFELVWDNAPFVVYSWSDYRKQYFPLPEEYAKRMTEDEWFEFLEEADSVAKIRKKLNSPATPQHGSNREQVAEWVAKRHMSADGGIREVWFLPEGAPEQEIRLLEVSERYTGESGTIEPLDFGIPVEGVNYTLLVADVSTTQIDNIRKNQTTLLPQGWKLEKPLIWGRRGRQQ